MTEQVRSNERRKPYRKPEIQRVVLVLEEAVLAPGCKTQTTGGGSGLVGSGDCTLAVPQCEFVTGT